LVYKGHLIVVESWCAGCAWLLSSACPSVLAL